jgi:hypothetical protein
MYPHYLFYSLPGTLGGVLNTLLLFNLSFGLMFLNPFYPVPFATLLLLDYMRHGHEWISLRVWLGWLGAVCWVCELG